MSGSEKKVAIGTLAVVVLLGGLYAMKKAKAPHPSPTSNIKKVAGVDKKVKAGKFELSDLLIGAEGSPETAPIGGRPKDGDDSQAKASFNEEPARPEAKPQPQAKATARVCWPSTFVKYAAIESVVDNTIQATTALGDVTYYFSSRGVVAETSGGQTTASIWTREGDRLCMAKEAGGKQCFALAVRVEKQLQDRPADEIVKRIKGMYVGARIGEVDGMGARAMLARGNVTDFPDYVPLLEREPKRQGSTPEPQELVGRLLARSRTDEDRAVTYFGPTGRLLEVARENWTQDAVKIAMGTWRLSGDRICSALPSGGGARQTEECSRFRIVEQTVEFPDADPSRRSYLRSLSPEEERAIAERATQAAQAQERRNSALTLAPATDPR